MKKMKKAGKSALSALLSASILISSIPVGTVTASAEAPVIDESAIAPAISFTYSTTVSTWDGTSYDFSWYENPATEGEYHITTAAQFAALTILTNDLTKGFATWAESLPDSCDPYLATVDNFEGETIYLDCDVNFQNRELLPISYVFDTPNITSDDYDALSHVPAYLTAVDEWVGDGKGNKIITRYLEIPEAEMRYRDLLYGANFDHEMVRWDYDSFTELGVYGGTFLEGLFHYDTGLLMYDKKDNGKVYHLVDNNYSRVGTSTRAPAVKPVDLDLTDIPRSYYYQNPYEQADNKGFAGTFEGQGNYIMNFTPFTPWTTDYMERALTYDPIGRGLFSMLDESGVIRELNLHGRKSAEFSYSALLCAYNYGTIDCCYVYMLENYSYNRLQSYVPIGRIYGEYNSEGNIIVPTTYEYSTSPQWVMAVGCSGILTSWNCGTISNCRVSGSVSGVGRQFGCISCINDGIIYNSINQATHSGNILPSMTGFYTDEFSYDNRNGKDGLKYGPSIEYSTNDNGLSVGDVSDIARIFKEAHDAAEGAADSAFYTAYPGCSTQSDLYDPYEWSSVTYSGSINFATYPYNSSAAAAQGYTSDNEAWVPYIRTQKEGQSLAANHIYGVYGLNCIGGICVLNNGSIQRCTNRGVLQEAMEVSPRGEIKALKNDTTSYIRPTNAFALFCTQLSTYSYSSAICVYNYGVVEGCNNTAEISRITAYEYMYSNADYEFYSQPLLFAYNGFYRNDCLVYDDYASVDDYIYNTGGYRWWLKGSSLEDTVYSDEYTIYGKYFDQFEDGNYTDSAGNTWVNPYEDEQVVAQFSYDYLPLIENMPYPHVAIPDTFFRSSGYYRSQEGLKGENRNLHDFYWHRAGSTHMDGALSTVRHGVTSLVFFNFGKITAFTDSDGTVYQNVISAPCASGAVYISEGLGDDVAVISDVVVTYGKTSNSLSMCTYAFDTDMYNILIETSGSNFSSIAWYVESRSDKIISIHDIVINNGSGGINKIVGNDERIKVYNWVNYANMQPTWELVSSYATNCDFEDIYLFGAGRTALGSLTECNARNIYVYGNVTGTGLGKGSIDEYVDNYHYYGYGASYAIGNLTGGRVSNIFINTINPDGVMQAIVGGLIVADCVVENVNIFAIATREVLICTDCDVNNVNVYIDTPYISTAQSDIFRFVRCNVDTALLQSNVDIEWAGFSSSQKLPGVLTNGSDTNVFKDVVVQTPNGAVSYSTYAFALEEDRSIKTDAKMIYDPDARVTGALAYWMDHGDQPGRTYNYTVATNDTYDLVDDNVLSHVDFSLTNMTADEVVTLPAYTRKRVNDTEPFYYRVTAPYTSLGAGELILETEDQKTQALGELFTVTSIYVPSNNPYFELSVHEEPGFGILSITKNSKSEGDTSEPIVKLPNKSTYGPITEDLVFNSEWTETYTISVEDNEFVEITPSATGSVPHERIDVSLFLSTETKEIKGLYYYNYTKNSDNDWVIDTSTKVDIPLSTMSFVMPNNPVMIGCEVVGNSVTLNSFRLAGVEGTIDSSAKLISVFPDDSVDIASLIPDNVDVSGAASVYPALTESQDFSRPVQYTFTAENGDSITYTVVVYPKRDGYITYFDLNGYAATVDNDTMTIDLYLPIQVNLKYARPTIVWSGLSITPEHVIDLSSLTGTYEVTSSSGSVTTYAVTVTLPEAGKDVNAMSALASDGQFIDFSIDTDNMTLSAQVPYGTDLSQVLISKLDFNGLASNLTKGDYINLSKGQTLVVQGVDGSTSRYRVFVRETPDTSKVLHQISLYGYEGVINEETGQVIIELPSKYDLHLIAPDVLTFTGKTVSGLYEKKDWTVPVVYVVEAYDGSSKEYTIRVISNKEMV